ncbi:hypothetical protein [Pseudoalteromonas sp. H105]|uniref:hypothetical protein n=1 Tax=Pseudoalteromonas sp. H105 TaxID=1348393 RepID=UPI000A55ABD4|nr:hypothetical protein [Pseudoalteromonas sp. H105]
MLIITTFEDCDVLVTALNLGARGYVLKNIELEELISAIKQVVAGKRVLQSAVTDEHKTLFKRHYLSSGLSGAININKSKQNQLINKLAMIHASFS